MSVCQWLCNETNLLSYTILPFLAKWGKIAPHSGSNPTWLQILRTVGGNFFWVLKKKKKGKDRGRLACLELIRFRAVLQYFLTVMAYCFTTSRRGPESKCQKQTPLGIVKGQAQPSCVIVFLIQLHCKSFYQPLFFPLKNIPSSYVEKLCCFTSYFITGDTQEKKKKLGQPSLWCLY